jgi:hypothetical protein
MSPVVAYNAAATWLMVGLIWFVQLVHYPLMDRAERASFAEYSRLHSQRTTWIVFPPMLLELVTSVWIALRPPAGVDPAEAIVGCGLVGVIWLSTFSLQVPQHRRFEQGFDAGAHRRLVRTNWIRTTAWTARGALTLWWLLSPGP